MPLNPHVRLGPYEILAPIGAGGMGEVYRAKDTRLNRTVAIKVLPAHVADNSGARQRMEREARAVSSLSHPHICVLHDIGCQDSIDFLVMEYLEGETLASRLAKGPLPLEQALRYAVEIASALSAAYRRGISHRDLKPANVMLTKSGTKLLDFGLAKLSESGAVQVGPGASTAPTVLEGLTEKGTVLGTFQYMAPEQLEAKETDVRSDIFSFGAVLYEMLTGRKAFEGKSQASVISAIMTAVPAAISSLQPLTPPMLDHVVEKCLAKDPDERWQHPQDLESELRWIAESGTQNAGAPVIDSRRKNRPRLGWGVASLLLAALAGILAWNYFRVTPQRLPVLRSSLLPPPNLSFVPYNFALSPDGVRLAFVAVGQEGKNVLWVRSLSGPGAQQLNGGEGAVYPFWSPDNRRIGFFADGKLKTIDIAGGAVKILGQAPAGVGGTWNREGTIVFAPAFGGPLYRISDTGGSPFPVTKLLRPNSGQGHRWPSFLPDGKHFLYFADWSSPGDPHGDGIYLASLGSDQVQRISDIKGNWDFSSGNLLYVHQRTLMAQPFDPKRLANSGPAVPIAEEEFEKDTAFLRAGFSASDSGVLVFQSAADTSSRLAWFDVIGKELGQLPETGYKDPHLSPEGRFLAVASDDERNGKHFIRIYDLERGISTRLTGEGTDEFPTWTRDGKHIAYLTGGASGSSISINEVSADGSGHPRVLLEGGMMIPNDWSPDGHLVFMDFRNGPVHLSVYSSATREVTDLRPNGSSEAQFSPDGKWIAFVGLEGRAGPQIFVQPFPGPGGRIQVSTAGGAQARWSRDGKRIFYVQPDKKLIEVSFDSRTKSTGAMRVLFQTRIVAPNRVLFQYDVAQDGRFIINSFPSNNSAPLTLLSGWPSLVRSR